MKRSTVSVVLIAVVGVVAFSAPAAAWWQFVAHGPHGERQVSPHYESEKECQAALKATETRLAKRFPDHYPLVGSCEQYRFEHDRNFD